EEFGQELIATFANLAPDVIKSHSMAKVGEGVNPSFGMQVDGVEEGAVNIENHGTGARCLIWHPMTRVGASERCVRETPRLHWRPTVQFDKVLPFVATNRWGYVHERCEVAKSSVVLAD
ncbi:hypothetical protein, partial [Campylobacter sp. 2018MI34]|uniref:hypothetical protein n=1 Tax=Campylobacter sp. 2018MI34 TaxID=2800582 RepID=UPI001AEF3542